MSDNTGFRSGVKNITNDRKSRLMLIGAGVLILGGAIFAFSPSTQTVVTSTVRGPGSLGENPQGGSQLTPAYRSAVEQSDVNRANEKQNTLPTPILNTDSERSPSLFSRTEEVGKGASIIPAPTPIAAPPSLTIPIPEAVKAPEVVQSVQAPANTPITYLPMDKDLIIAMQGQMKNILNKSIKPSETVYLYNQETPGQGRSAGTAATTGSVSTASAGTSGLQTPVSGNAASPANQPAQNSQQRASRFAPPAPGTILYSRLIGRVNSDVPGPVLAEISQGPLRGARLLGAFQFTEQGVIIQFSSMTVPFTDDGLERTEVVPIKGVAVDAENLGTAMSTSIDRRILERVAFGFATSFIQGLGQAITQAGSTTTVLPGGAVSYGLRSLKPTEQLMSAAGSSAATTGRIIDQTYGNRRTTIIVDADTAFGLLFLGNSSGAQ